MEEQERTRITVTTTVAVSPELAWVYWTEPKHITQWNQASDDWHTPSAEQDLRVGGRFSSRMESRDGKYGFDFWGVYDAVEPNQLLAYTIGDGRKVSVLFEAESENSAELQRAGWQAILDSFKRYVERQ